MSVGSYQHSQHNHLQPKSQLPHFDNGQNPAQFIPPNGTNNENVHIAGNEVKYAEQVNDHHLASVPPDASHILQGVNRMSLEEAQFPYTQFPPNSVPAQNFSENSCAPPNVWPQQIPPNSVNSTFSPKEVHHIPQYTYMGKDGKYPGNAASVYNTQNVSSASNSMSRPAFSHITHRGAAAATVAPPLATPPLATPSYNNNNNAILPPMQKPNYNQFNHSPQLTHSMPPNQLNRYDHTNVYSNNIKDGINTMPAQGGLGYSPSPITPALHSNNYQQFHQQSHLAEPSEMQNPRRLDPDQMPNPIQVMKEDEELRGGETFLTNQPGLVPPLVTTNFTVEDEGNCSPRFIRSTMYSVPCTIDMMKQADVPFSLVITPLATLPQNEQPPPIVNTGEFGPVRCVRCKAYMNPFFKFIDGGRRFVCSLCSAVTEVPAEYFQHLDHTGARVDRFERPELIYGTYEFTVTKEYCKDNEMPNVPAFIFVINVSYSNMKSGMVKLFCDQILDLVQNHLPRDDGAVENDCNSRMRIGFITYDSTVHFYNIKACLGQPQMMIVGDMDDMFIPLLDGFLCDPTESLTVINTLLQQIPNSFCDTKETDTLLLPAVQAGLEALKAAKCAGKLLIFHSSLPTANVPGKLINREDRKLLGTDKEKTLLSPQNSVYTNLAQECVKVGCSVDLFIFNNSYTDLATIGQLCKLTGGEIFKYTYFQADIDGERFIEDLKRNLQRQIAFDAVMRVRTSTGVRPVSFYGHMNMSTATDIELASINADKSIAVEIKHDDKMNEEDNVFIQVALLYTSCSGRRRVRIFNLVLKCCSQMAELFRHCELDTLINYWAKAATAKLLEGTPRQIKESLRNRCARILVCYRKLCANPSSPGQLILPESMKLLPLYTNCLLKSDVISGGSDMTADDRYFMMQAATIMDIPSSLNYFYPRLIPLINIDASPDQIPFPIRCAAYKISNSEAYILENGIYMFIWIGIFVPKEWLVNVFGVADVSSINVNTSKLPMFDNIHSRKINSLIHLIQTSKRRTMKLTIVRENDKMEIVFKRFLVEDVSSGYGGDTLSCSSYVDFLCQMHKEIRNMLT